MEEVTFRLTIQILRLLLYDDDSQYVYKRVLEDNHRHIAIDEVFELLNGM